MNERKGILCLKTILIGLVCVFTDVESANIQITPSATVGAGSTSLTIRCSPSISELTKVYAINIKQRKNQNTEELMASIDAGGQVAPQPKFPIPKYVFTGSVTLTDVSASYLQVVITNPDCNEQAEYQCVTPGTDSQGGAVTPTPQENRNVTVGSNPRNINMNVVPERGIYAVNTSLTLRCAGEIGSPRQTWKWDRKALQSSQWQRINTNIVNHPIRPPSGSSCSETQDTVLTYVVQSQDQGLQIRCILNSNEQFSDNKTIYTSYQYTTPSVGGNTGDPADADIGMIVGIVVACLVVIVIVVVVVVLLLRRKKKAEGEDYDTGEGGKNKGTSHMPPETRDNEMKHGRDGNDVRSQGVVNKSLDEPHQTDRRPYNYHNNGGHRNPGMDNSDSDDNMPRKNEYMAEDGTDIRGSNAMLGSAV